MAFLFNEDFYLSLYLPLWSLQRLWIIEAVIVPVEARMKAGEAMKGVGEAMRVLTGRESDNRGR